VGKRVDDLVARLTKGAGKTAQILGGLRDDQWQMALYTEPLAWTVRDLAAHFLSAEVALLRVMQDVASGGPGAPEDFNYDDFNSDEQTRLAGLPLRRLLADLVEARAATIAWASNLNDSDLDRCGRHPALGDITLESFINAIYGHQLMHMRDLQRLLA
jgi:hypothetical protein